MHHCTGTEQSLNDCSSFDVSENICQLPSATIVVCSKFTHITCIKLYYKLFVIFIMYLFHVVDYANRRMDGQLRLTGGGETNGKLEYSLNGYWGTVCSETFTRAAADVACKELGFNESMKFIPRLVATTEN